MSTKTPPKGFVRNAVIGLVVGVTVGIAGLATAAVTRNEDPPTASRSDGTPGSYSGGRVSAGEGLDPDTASQKVLRGLEGTSVRAIELIEPVDTGTSGGREPWVSTTLDSDQGDDVETIWLGALAQGAVADLMRTEEERTADVVGGGQIVLRDVDGNPVTIPIGTGSVLGGQDFDSPSDGALKARAQAVAEQFGITLKSVAVLHPLSSALSVTFVVPDGEVNWAIEDLRKAIDGTPKSLEGHYIQLESPSGVSLLRAATAYRIGLGGQTFGPKQDLRFNSAHGGLPAAPTK